MLLVRGDTAVRVALLFLVLRSGQAETTKTKVKLCVVENKLADCQQLEQSVKNKFDLECISARHRVDCMHKVKDGHADVVNLPSNEAYAAAANFTLVPILEEKTEQGSFMYEGVAVVRISSNINSLADLKGKKSCHTGYGRTVGWDIPVSLLIAKNILDLSNCNNDLAAINGFFNGSCIPGNWSKDEDEDQKLKRKYLNLCSLCGCNQESEAFISYEGALACLTKKSADIAFTKHSAVVAENLNPNEFNYLCSDGSQSPLDKPCVWAARPNPLLMAKQSLTSERREEIQMVLRAQLQELSRPLPKFYVGTLVTTKDSFELRRLSIDTKEYLDEANFTITMDKPLPSHCRENYARFCVTSDIERSKCQDLKLAAFASRLRPHIECIQKQDADGCLEAIEKGSADISSFSANEVFKGGKNHKLESLMSEVFSGSVNGHYAVAVIKNNSDIKSLKDLKGRKSCHSFFGCTTSWYIPIATLASKGLLTSKGCSLTDEVSQFFSASCVPGASNPKLCELCSNNGKGTEKCNGDSKFAGYKGAFQCLSSGKGDVAFVKHTTVLEYTDKQTNEEWAQGLKSSDFMLLCPNDEIKPVHQFKSCNWQFVPPKQMMVLTETAEDKKENMRLMLIRASNLFTKESSIFRMFGVYSKKPSIMFSENAITVEPSKNKDYRDILKGNLTSLLEITECTLPPQSSASPIHYNSLLLSVTLFLLVIWHT